MIVEGKQVPPEAEVGLECWMLSGISFTAAQAAVCGEDQLRKSGGDPDVGFRFADRMIQRLRKAGKISFAREDGLVRWTATA